MITGALMRVGLILGIIISFAGGTYAMADSSLPDAPLYSVKLAIEEIQLDLYRDPAQRAAQHLVLAQNRVQEIIRLAHAGDVADGGTLVRLEEHLNMALKLAAQLGEEGMLGVLNKAYLMLQVQNQELTRTQAQVGEPLQEPLGQAIRVLNRIRERVEAGLQDPEAFRWQYQYGAPAEPQQPGGKPDCPDCEQHQYGPREPGDQDCPGCKPQGDQKQYGPGPEQPGGDQDCQDCEPQGDQKQYGPGPEQPGGDQKQHGPGPEQPGGDQDCPDCEPQGDQNQHGPGPEQPGGDQGCQDCEPQGDQNQHGPGPEQPGGDQDCQDCDPQGDQHQHGPAPEQPGSGGPSQPSGPGDPGGDQGCTDCEPQGDQNQNGGPSGPGGH